MKFKTVLKKWLVRLDQFSPYPMLYAFIMSKKEKVVFDDAVRESSHYLEFGMGGSTLRALRKSKAMVWTVESSQAWIDHMRNYLVIKRFENTRLQIFQVNIGPVGSWGYPISDAFKDKYESYSSNVFNFIDNKLVDLALIDGRFRVACALKTIMECHENARVRILVHDFWERPQYHVLLKYLTPIKRVDSIGLFSIKQGVDMVEVGRDYGEYKFKPE